MNVAPLPWQPQAQPQAQGLTQAQQFKQFQEFQAMQQQQQQQQQPVFVQQPQQVQQVQPQQPVFVQQPQQVQQVQPQQPIFVQPQQGGFYASPGGPPTIVIDTTPAQMGGFQQEYKEATQGVPVMGGGYHARNTTPRQRPSSPKRGQMMSGGQVMNAQTKISIQKLG